MAWLKCLNNLGLPEDMPPFESTGWSVAPTEDTTGGSEATLTVTTSSARVDIVTWAFGNHAGAWLYSPVWNVLGARSVTVTGKSKTDNALQIDLEGVEVTISASNDGVAWTDVGTYTNSQTTDEIDWTCTASIGGYKYVKVTASHGTDNVDPDNNHGSYTEITSVTFS